MKKTLCIPASLVLVLLLAFGLGSCGQESTTGSAAKEKVAPPNEFDALINDYEKVANEYVRVSKKHQSGDVSITVRVIELRNRTRELAAKVQQTSGKMTPQQAQRVAAISSKTAPYLQS